MSVDGQDSDISVLSFDDTSLEDGDLTFSAFLYSSTAAAGLDSYVSYVRSSVSTPLALCSTISLERYSSSRYFINSSENVSISDSLKFVFDFSMTDGSLLFHSDQEVEVELSALTFGFVQNTSSGSYRWYSLSDFGESSSFMYGLKDSSGDWWYFDCDNPFILGGQSQKRSSYALIDIPSHDFDVYGFCLVAKCQLSELEFFASYNSTYSTYFSSSFPAYYCSFVFGYGCDYSLYDSYTCDVFIRFSSPDQSIGLLNSIIAYLQAIVGNISSMASNISQLPVKIVTELKDGLIALFVPSDEDFSNILDDWRGLLSERLGALYETSDILIDFFSGLGEYSERSTIEFPSVSIPVGDGVTYDFGGWEVKVVPDGFSALFTALKLIIDIVATCAFLSGLKRRFERLVGDR